MYAQFANGDQYNSIIIFYTSTEFAVVFVLIVQYSFTIIILIP